MAEDLQPSVNIPDPLNGAPVETADNPLLSNENVPIVSFDINLGKKYQFVDFDYEAFDEEANRLGISDEDKGGLSIEIKRKPSLINYRSRGSYWENHISVVSRKKVNQSFSHELKHYADDKVEPLTIDTRYRIGKFSGYALAGLINAGLLELAIGEMPGPKQDEIFHHADDRRIFGAAMGTAFLARLWGYTLNPVEVRARKAAKQSQANIVTLDKR